MSTVIGCISSLLPLLRLECNTWFPLVSKANVSSKQEQDFEGSLDVEYLSLLRESFKSRYLNTLGIL